MNKATRLKTMAAALGMPTCRLRDLERVGVVVRRPDGAFDVEKNRTRYDLFRRGDVDGLNEAIWRAAAEVEQAIAAVDPAARGFKRAARRVERALLDLHDILRLARAMRPDDTRLISDLHNKLLSRARGAMAERMMARDSRCA